MLNAIELKLPSNWINALNFVIFDVVLISCVFYFTADIMGRLNDSALRDGEPRRLFIACPPVLGGGMSTTHRFRAVLLIFARFLGLALILMTNLTIEGVNRIEVFDAMDTVLARGDISNFDELQFETAAVLRSACQGRRPPSPSKIEGNGPVIYYGELRGEKFADCVTNRTLLTGTIVEFGTEIFNRTVDTGKPCEGRLRQKNNWRVAEFFCPKATIACVFPLNETSYNLDSCRGLVEHENETFICEEGSCFPEMDSEYTEVRWVSGLDFRKHDWLDAWYISPALLKDAFDATFAADKEVRMVRKTREVPWTLVNPLWFAAFAFKVILVAALAFTSFSLRRAGYQLVAHDEQRLAELLQTGLDEVDTGRRRTEQQVERSIYLNAREGAGGLLVYADAYPRQEGTAAVAEEAGDMSRRNPELHDVEAMYF